jgi:hypothetical protein
MIGYGILSVPTHDLLVLDLSLFWFIIKKKGRCFDTMLGWLHWFYDYT